MQRGYFELKYFHGRGFEFSLVTSLISQDK